MTTVTEAEVINVRENDSGTLRIFHSKMLLIMEDIIIASNQLGIFVDSRSLQTFHSSLTKKKEEKTREKQVRE